MTAVKDRLLREVFEFAQKLKDKGYNFSLDVTSVDGKVACKVYTDANNEIRVDSREYCIVNNPRLKSEA